MINLLVAVVFKASKALLLSMLTERVILKLTLEIMEWLSKRSNNSVDDNIVLNEPYFGFQTP